MKILQLHQEYPRLSRLCKEDEKLFTNLLKGGSSHRQQIERYIREFGERDLFIVPVQLGTSLVCNGFIIERYQLFFSESDQLYLVFLPIEHNPPYCYVAMHSVYKVQDNLRYICLKRQGISVSRCPLFPFFGELLLV